MKPLHTLEYRHEAPSAEVFNELLFEARSLHFGAQVGESYGDFTVRKHSDVKTVMDVYTEKYAHINTGSRHLMLEVNDAGVIVHNVRRSVSEDSVRVLSRSLLLSTYNDSLILAESKKVSKDWDNAGYDTSRLLRAIRQGGAALAQGDAIEWLDGIRELRESVDTSDVASSQKIPFGKRVHRSFFKKHVAST